MRKFIPILILTLATSTRLFADSGSGESAAGSLNSRPPAAPTLNTPLNSAADVTSPEVTWNGVTHAASYHLQVSTVSDFATTVADETGLTGTSYSVPGLSTFTQYYWHVCATNVAGSSEYSGTWDFITGASLPVTLSSFSAEPASEGVLIKWITESETDHLGFILEQKESAAQAWHIIASYQSNPKLAGRGNTSTQIQYAVTDQTAIPGHTYQYRLSDVNNKGKVHICDIIQIALYGVSEATTLDPPFPNPFNPITKINYTLANPDHVEIVVYDLLGRKVQTLFNDNQPAGSYNVYWQGNNESGLPVASGTYLILLKTSTEIKKQKAVLVH